MVSRRDRRALKIGSRRAAVGVFAIFAVLSAGVIGLTSFPSEDSSAATVSASSPCIGAAAPSTGFKHVVEIWFENTSAGSGGQVSGAPFVNSLITGCGHVSRWTDGNYKVDGTTKDGSYNSRPSYVTAATGVSPTVHGVTSDSYTSKTTRPNIWAQAQAAGIDARAYMEGRASGDVCSGGGSSSGSYHDSLRAVSPTITNAWCNQHDQDLSAFDPAHLPTYAAIFPKNTSNWHDNSTASGDTWLKTHLTPLLNSPAYAAGDVAVVFHTDEDTPVVNAVIAPSVTPGAVIANASHFSMTRLVDDVLGQPELGDSPRAVSLLSLLGGGTSTTTTSQPSSTTSSAPSTTTSSSPPSTSTTTSTSTSSTSTTTRPAGDCSTTTRTYSGVLTGQTRPGTISGNVNATRAVWTGQTAYPITTAATAGACWTGGIVWGSWAPSVPWTTLHGTGAFNAKGGAPNLTIRRTVVVNYGDAYRFEANAPNWTLDHVRATGTRDDAVENDWTQSGHITDSLLESYVVYSARPSPGQGGDGSANHVLIDNSLLRLEPTLTVFKGPANGTGPWFKNDEDHSPSWSPKVTLLGNVLRADKVPNHGDLNPPPGATCDGNTILWTGAGHFPAAAVWNMQCSHTTIVEGAPGLVLWEQAVNQWVSH